MLYILCLITHSKSWWSIFKFFVGLNIPSIHHSIKSAREEIAASVNVFFSPCSGTHHTTMALWQNQILFHCFYYFVLASIRHTVRLLRGRRASRWPLRSKRSTLRLSRGTAITLVGETDTLFTGLSQRMEARGERIFRKSHTLAVRSSEPETTLSSRVKVTQVTTL